MSTSPSLTAATAPDLAKPCELPAPEPAALRPVAPLQSLQPTLKLAAPPPSRSPASSRTLKLSPGELAAWIGAPGSAPSKLPPQPALPSVPTTVPSAPPRATVRRRSLLAGGLAGAVALGVAAFAVAQALASTSTRWVAPLVLSSADPRVVQVAATLQQETARRSDLLLQKKEIETRLDEARESVALEESFQASFKAALRSDLAAERAELRHLETLLAWRDASKGAASAVPFGADLDAKVSTIQQRVRLLESASRSGRAAAGYDVLTFRRELDRSQAAGDQARALSAALTRTLAETTDVLKQKETLLASLEASPYRLAIAGDVTLGFVPYDNVAEVKTGEALVACKTSLLFCHPVGTVGELLAGEVRGTNPLDGQETRGRLVRLLLTEPRSAERPTLLVRPSQSRG